ncbi:MAG: hypothetical protein KDA28_11550, partial [Phycisphaerales bacterium]|nr:hypothetical protein [Phycisphaerales bacterium]
MSRFLITLIVATGMLACPSSLRAQTFPDVPSDTIAWVACDPGVLARGESSDLRRARIDGAVRAVLAHVLVQDDAASDALAPILGAALDGETPFRLSLIGFEGESHRTGRDNGITLSACRMIVEVHATSGAMRRALDASTRQDAWPDWLTIESRESGGLLTVGIGTDALRAWDNMLGRASGHWQTHQAAARQARPNSQPFFQCYVDLNALRRGMPEAFVNGRGDRLLEILGLRNTRSIMFHGMRTPPERVGVQGTQGTYTGPPLLSVLATYSSRSRGYGNIGAQLFGSSIVGGIESDVGTPDDGWQSIAAFDPDRLIALGVGLYR